MSKVKASSVVVGLLLAAGVWYGVSNYSTPNFGHSISREECKKQRNSKKTAKVTLFAEWGGSQDATISYSVEQDVVEPQDYPPPKWTTQINVRQCDLIILIVTPTEGEGTTSCEIHLTSQPGRGIHVTNPNGGRVECSHWYQSPF